MFSKIHTITVLLYVCGCICCVVSQEVLPPDSPTEIFVDDEFNHTWTSINFPQPYPLQNQTLIVKVGVGYTIFISITDLNIDSERGDFLFIKPGTTLNDQNKGKVFTHVLKSEKKYVVDYNNVTIGFRVFGQNATNQTGFSLIYQRQGVLVTTEEPVTEITWPTPGATDRIYFIGNVSGRDPEDFNNTTVVNDLKRAIAQMAVEHCIAQNISFKDNITELNVQIKNLIRCPLEWPNSNKCVKILFSIPIFLSEESNTTKYELSSQNLQLMWSQYSEQYLKQVGLSLYKEPNPKFNLLLWLVVSSSIVIAFLLLLLSARIASARISRLKKKRRYSDTQSIVKNEMRNSNLSLSPHQEIPPFFEIDSSFRTFEPDIRGSTKQNDYISDDESDDEITISRFNNSHHNVINRNHIESST